MKTLLRFLKDEDGLQSIEYGLLAALISIAAIGSMTALGGQLNITYTAMGAALSR